MNMLPPAIAIFSALLKQNGFEVDLFDTTYHRMEADAFEHDKTKESALQVLPTNMAEKGIYEKTTSAFDDLADKVDSFQPDLIAMSTVEDTFKRGIRLLEHIRHYGIPTIVGGVFPTFAPEKVITHDCVDMVCVGEGETLLLELCDRMDKRKDYDNIPGLWIKTRNGIKKNQIGDLYSLDDLPLLDFAIFEEGRLYRPMAGKIYRMLPVEMDRGCPYQCNYCCSPAQNRLYRKSIGCFYYRKRSIKNLHDELSYYRDYWKAEYFYFTADTLLAVKSKEFDEFIEMYSDIKVPFYFNTRPETVSTFRLECLKNVGLHRMSMGCEHGDEEFRRKVVRRNNSNKQIIRAFDCSADLNIPTTVNNIVGFPNETRSLTFETIKINRRLKVDTMNCVIFTPFHGTELREIAVKKGYLDDSVITNCLLEGSLLNMPHFPPEQINAIMKTFCLYARLDKSRWGDIEKVERNFGSSKVEKLYRELRQEYKDRYFSGVSVS
ncbi:MAG: B12-binding domain-containing radical SAM protein [Deltaproteobacteria bacterium]|nr:B12-binding domain-containing radical SAM protein [Deltaproteobacteria bacterium]